MFKIFKLDKYINKNNLFCYFISNFIMKFYYYKKIKNLSKKCLLKNKILIIF